MDLDRIRAVLLIVILPGLLALERECIIRWKAEFHIDDICHQFVVIEQQRLWC